MKSILRKYIHGLSAFLAVIGSAPYAQADDTEIFFGNPSGNGTIPNVLFILDNSGSMSTNVTTESIFDPSVTYSGSNDQDEIAVYQSTNRGLTYKGVIYRSQTHCKDMLDKLDTAGQYSSAKVAAYKNNRWQNILQPNYWWQTVYSDNSPTECYADRNIHGKDASSSNKYARSGVNTGKWTSNSSNELNWNNIAVYEYYSANYLNWYFGHRTTTVQSRLQIMKGVINNLVDSTSGINIGLMSFNTNNSGTQGGRVGIPLDYIEDNRSAFKSNLNSLSAETWTPLAETLYEAKRYYEGGDVFLGSQSVSGSKQASNSSKYQSPIVSECQPNNIVLLTDGQPTYDAHLSGDYNYNNDRASRSAIENDVGSCDGNCLEEIAKYMHDNDLRGDLVDTQNIKTYTIGFGFGSSDTRFLQETAEGDSVNNVGGGGQYFSADDTTQLETALKSIISNVKSTNTTFVTPGVAVNTFNRLNHRNELYYSVFEPKDSAQWVGNLKRYKLGNDGVIYDSAGNAAVNTNSGFFKNGSKSWWSGAADGSKVSLGGAASKLPNTNADRNVYTYISGNSKDLSNASNEVSVANKSNITKSLLDITSASDTDHERLISWIRGADSQDEDGDGDITEARKVIMDPLHSPPVVVIYGGTNTAPDTTVFFGDNQGFLHAINSSGNSGSAYGSQAGEEIFAFIPEDLFDIQQTLFDNSISASHPYGLDGAIAVWTHDDNKDNDLYDSGDFAYIYSGMRRGGNNYYALDVTNRNSPKMLWQIKGGGSGTAGFEELAQTWSQPAISRIKVGTTEKDVLIFGGGYDTNQDSATTRSIDSVGRAIYIVDAKTGALIWSGGPSNSNSTPKKVFSDMNYSIPSSIRIIDVNGDDLVDQMYVGDMGGQVWRFDINNGAAVNNLVDGAVIADLADNTAAGNRRFYHEPSVSIINDGGTRKLAISIGSGWQAHPLATTTEDRLYLLKDQNVTRKPGDNNNDGKPDYAFYNESGLYDATDNHLGHVSSVNTLAQQVQANLELGQKGGWYIRLTRSGEKVMASSLVFDGQLFFTTYEPVANNNGCSASVGTPRMYHVYLENATPVVNYDGIGKDTELTRPDRETALKTSSLPTEPIRLRIDGVNIICVGTECDLLPPSESVIETYWVEEG